MNYTSLAYLTDEELLRDVYSKDDPTDHEIELAERLDYALEFIDAMLEEQGGNKPSKPKNRYVGKTV